MTRSILYLTIVFGLLFMAAILHIWTAHANPAGGLPVERVSIANNENEGNDASTAAAISPEGRFVAFESDATNLVAGDNNGDMDIFVRDVQLGSTRRASLTTGGNGGNQDSFNPDISASNGRYVVFESLATNLAANDNNSTGDVFLRDMVSDTTTLVSESDTGGTGNGLSRFPRITPDGEFVAFSSLASDFDVFPVDTNGQEDCFVWDRTTAAFNRINTSTNGEFNDNCSRPDISAGSPIIAFESTATNVLQTPDANGGASDIFIVTIYDTGHTLISVDSNGNQANSSSYYASVSRDGEHVAFMSFADNLAPNDTNGQPDVFLRNLVTGETRRVSVASDGTQGNLASYAPAISGDGRYVAFASDATNLVPGDTTFRRDVFVHDTQTGITERLSVSDGGIEGNERSDEPAISANGEHVAFESEADNLIAADTNSASDVFRKTIAEPSPTATPTLPPTNTPPSTHTATATATGTVIPPTSTPTGTLAPPTTTATPSVTPTGTLTPATSTPSPMPTTDPTEFPPTATVSATGTTVPLPGQLFLPLIVAERE